MSFPSCLSFHHFILFIVLIVIVIIHIVFFCFCIFFTKFLGSWRKKLYLFAIPAASGLVYLINTWWQWCLPAVFRVAHTIPQNGSDLSRSGKESACHCRSHRFNPWVRKIPCRRKWQLTPVFLHGKFHGQRSLGRLLSMGSWRVRHKWAHTDKIKKGSQYVQWFDEVSE